MTRTKANSKLSNYAISNLDKKQALQKLMLMDVNKKVNENFNIG